MVKLEAKTLVFSNPDVHQNAKLTMSFQQTLRLPDDNREYSLPPGLGQFPIEKVETHAKRVPSDWNDHGGVLLPMRQAEAMWISFGAGVPFGQTSYPYAVKIAAGKINALTGEAWQDKLVADPQDYMVTPDQPWLDGFCVRKGLIRQFVAMPLGKGYTAEEQIMGEAEHGGLQIIAYPMKRERYEEMLEDKGLKSGASDELQYSTQSCSLLCSEMGLAPGGLMRQEIYEDEYGIDAWDLSAPSRCFVHILNSEYWLAVTGTQVPGAPPSVQDYEQAGLPWFEYYEDKLNALGGSSTLANLDSVAAKGVKKGESPLPENNPVSPKHVVKLEPDNSLVKDGNW